MRAEYIRDFSKELRFPGEAVEFLYGEALKIEQNAPLYAVMNALRDVYLAIPDRLHPFLDRLDQQAEAAGINRLTLHLLYLLWLTDELRARYERAGIPDEVFLKSMEDFRCKLTECRACHGVWGNATADWHCGFFTMDRFGLGRMQYNHTPFRQDEYTFGNLTVKKGDRVLAMHIPSAGPMPVRVRIDSYKKAYDFYKERGELRDGLLIITCRSWLLFPKHREMLPQESNIVSFLDDFDIVDAGETEKFGDDWRVFGKYASLPPERWPRDTMLRKAYAEWICSGNKAGYGDGVLLFDGERIANAGGGRK